MDMMKKDICHKNYVQLHNGCIGDTFNYSFDNKYSLYFQILTT